MRKLTLIWLLLAALALFATACDDDDSNESDVTADAEDLSSEDLSQDTINTDTPEDSTSNDFVVHVQHGGSEADVALDELSTTTLDDTEVVLISEILAASGHQLPEHYVLDFVASDGFSPGDSENCVDFVPVDGLLAAQGGLEPATADLYWSEAAGQPGCLGVKEVSTILVSEAINLEVTYGGESITLNLADLSDQTLVTIGDVEVFSLSTLIQSAFPGLDATSVHMDVISSDGFSPSMSPNCEDQMPIDGTLAVDGGVDPETKDLYWSEDLGLPGCMGVNDLATLALEDK